MRPASAVTVLVDDQTLTMVSAVHGLVFAASAWPPHMSTTVSPPMSMAIAAPISSPSRSPGRVHRPPCRIGRPSVLERRRSSDHDASVVGWREASWASCAPRPSRWGSARPSRSTAACVRRGRACAWAMASSVDRALCCPGRLGAHLARVELAEALTVLARRMPNLRRTGPAPSKPITEIAGPTTLPVAFTAGH